MKSKKVINCSVASSIISFKNKIEYYDKILNEAVLEQYNFNKFNNP